jgi:hypothetical protein
MCLTLVLLSLVSFGPAAPEHRFARQAAEDLIHRVDLLVENLWAMSQAFLHEITEIK